MENRDMTLIHELMDDEPELRKLMDEHTALELRLDTLGKLPYLSDDEVLEQRQLKKRKLVGRDRIEEILARHR